MGQVKAQWCRKGAGGKKGEGKGGVGEARGGGGEVGEGRKGRGRGEVHTYVCFRLAQSEGRSVVQDSKRLTAHQVTKPEACRHKQPHLCKHK